MAILSVPILRIIYVGAVGIVAIGAVGLLEFGGPPKAEPEYIEPSTKTNDSMSSTSPIDEAEVGAEHVLPRANSGLVTDEELQSEFDTLRKADKQWWTYPSTVRGCMRASYVRSQPTTYNTVYDRCSDHYR